ncbi:MAG: hypothetical protein M2R45_03907 [Verrucomicrobia subdivision 3 bacterium]|nr:hypothetical protein [Limisphaerales bacterium]MCS1417512.1 hypothetical protein [Limisphaerales bacterium]
MKFLPPKLGCDVEKLRRKKLPMSHTFTPNKRLTETNFLSTIRDNHIDIEGRNRSSVLISKGDAIIWKRNILKTALKAVK